MECFMSFMNVLCVFLYMFKNSKVIPRKLPATAAFILGFICVFCIALKTYVFLLLYN